MGEERALTTIPAESMALSFEDTMRLGGVLVKSGYFRDLRDASQAVVKILLGRELRIGAMTAIRGIHIVEGKPELSAGLMAGMLQRDGYSWREVQLDDAGCILDLYHNGKLLGRASFMLEDAQTAGLAGKQNYKGYGPDMFFARAISRGARRFAPGVLMGNVYVEGEIGMAETPAPVTTAEGEIIDGEPPTPSAPRFLDDANNCARVVAYLETQGIPHDDAMTAVGDWRHRDYVVTRADVNNECRLLITRHEATPPAAPASATPAEAPVTPPTPEPPVSEAKAAPAAALATPVGAPDWLGEVKLAAMKAKLPTGIRDLVIAMAIASGSTRESTLKAIAEAATASAKDPDGTRDYWQQLAREAAGAEAKTAPEQAPF
jgi:hypothetical protein